MQTLAVEMADVPVMALVGNLFSQILRPEVDRIERFPLDFWVENLKLR